MPIGYSTWENSIGDVDNTSNSIWYTTDNQTHACPPADKFKLAETGYLPYRSDKQLTQLSKIANDVRGYGPCRVANDRL